MTLNFNKGDSLTSFWFATFDFYQRWSSVPTYTSGLVLVFYVGKFCGYD